jgi:nondiscriminating aspartyl-tRNA synthetase
MNKTSIAKITPGKKCKIQGFVENIRNKRTIAFIVIKDITGKIQVTIDKQSNPDLSDTINRLTLQSFVTVTGTVLVNEYVKLNGVEMIPDDIVIESLAEPLPIQDDSSIDLKMDYR